MTRAVGKDHNGGPRINEDVPSLGGDGWVAVRRELRGHHLVGFGKAVEPADRSRGFCYSRAEAWIDLIMECRYKDGSVMNGGRRMELKAGQLTGARSWLAHRWNWTPMTVRWFLEQLEQDGMIERHTPGVVESEQPANNPQRSQQRGKQAQVLTICNYLTYQLRQAAQEPAREPDQNQNNNQHTTSTQPANNQNLTKEEGKKEEREESCPNVAAAPSDAGSHKSNNRRRVEYSPDFERFWLGYPDRTNNSKINAWVEWTKLSPDDRQEAIGSLPSYAAFLRSKPDHPVVHAERFLKQRRFESQWVSVSTTPHSAWWQDAAKVAGITVERWVKAIDQHANGLWPVDKLGPPPGHKDCVVPQSVMIEKRLTEIYDANGFKRRQ